MYESSPTETNQKKDKKEQIMKKIRQLENQQKILLNRQRDMERRVRTRRLIEHGAILESVFPELAVLPGEQVKAFLLALSHLPEAAELLKNTVKNETTEYPQDSKGALMHRCRCCALCRGLLRSKIAMGRCPNPLYTPHRISCKRRKRILLFFIAPSSWYSAARENLSLPLLHIAVGQSWSTSGTA